MPGFPLVTLETSSYNNNNNSGVGSGGGGGDQMCRRGDTRLHLSSSEEEVEVEVEEQQQEEVEDEEEEDDSLSVYCKPVELYNILQRRAVRNPLFLQRCLYYKIHAKHNARIQMTISLPMAMNDDAQSQYLFPLYVLLARRVSDIAVADYPAVYRFTRACVLAYFSGVEGNAQAQANFVLPEINKLALEAKSGSLSILLVSFAGAPSSTRGIDLTRGQLESDGGCSLLGRIPLDSLYRSWEQSPNLDLGQRAQITSAVVMNSCFLKLSYLNEDKCLSVQIPSNGETGDTLQQVHVSISAEEVGANEKSPYDSYMYNDISSSSLSKIMRLRAGNVIFNYRYCNNKLQKTEVTEDFTCPFCLVKCASFKGLRHHLPASHDLFNFEFWITEELQAVNISVKNDYWRSEIVADGVDPKQQTFLYCARKGRRKRSRNVVQHGHYVRGLESNLRGVAADSIGKAAGEYAEYASSSYGALGNSGSAEHLYQDSEDAQLGFGSNFAHPTMLQFAKSRKLYIERPDVRNQSLLHKRQFFHSHRAQPMAIEQVLSDRDSEDEVDDDVADIEDIRMLDDFVDVTKDEKQMMHLWNSFVRKQRVLADGHIPWACEAFSRLHGNDLIREPALIWCWRLFMIKLWNHGLLDARTMNTCNIALEQFQKELASDPTE